MRKRLIITLLAMLPACAHAQLITHYLRVDTTRQTEPFESTITRGSTPYFRVQVLNNGAAVTNLGSYGVYMFYATNGNASSGVLIQGTATNNTNGYAYIQFTSDQALGIYSNSSDYPATFWGQVVVTNSTGKVYDWSQGRVRIRPGGAVEGAATVVLNGAESDPVFSAWVVTGSGGSGSGFPATNHMNAAGYNLTNAGTVQASAFQGGTFSGSSFSGGNFSGGNMTLSGNLTVNSNVTYNTVINESTTVYLGTNYITNTAVTQVYTTNNVYLYTNLVEVNWVTNYTEYQTYVNVGGYFDAGLSDWVVIPHLTDSNDVVTASGTWDFTGAIVTGITASGGSTITNIGYGLTGTGDETALAVDTSLIATGTPLYAYTETDPDFGSWRANDFTSAVEALVGSTAVTNASVLSYGVSNLVHEAVALNTNDFGWDGSTLTVTAATGGGSASKLITSWSIYGTQATNISPVTTNGVQYLNFAVNDGGGYVDTKRFVFSNATYKAAYITAYAYGATGTCSLVVRVNSDEPTTNILNLSASISTNSFTLTNSLLPLSENTVDWGIIGGTATNDIRVRSFTIKVDAE
jgi:hypothetical protein